MPGLGAILLLDQAERNSLPGNPGILILRPIRFRRSSRFFFDLGDGDGKVDAAFKCVGLGGSRFHEKILVATGQK